MPDSFRMGPRQVAGISILVACLSSASPAQVPFNEVTIDLNAGDLKLVGDIDLDGTLDVVLGGSPGEDLIWYHYPAWSKTKIATPATEFTTDGELGDVDADGDLDIVSPDGSGAGNLLWFENPVRHLTGPGGDPFAGSQWVAHTIGTIGSWGKDVELADFDGDGTLDVATRHNNASMIFFQTSPGTWQKVTLAVASLGNEGMASGDIDHDGNVDLVHRGTWHRNPGGLAARTAGQWSEFTINTSGAVSNTFKALVEDIDLDGTMDVLFSSSESTAAVIWCEPTTGNPTGSWSINTVVSSFDKAHTLQAGDIDQDGDIDVIVGQMHTSTTKELAVFFNLDGAGTVWSKYLVDVGSGIHNGVVVDIGADGDLDIVGANWTGNPPLRLWENLTPQPNILFDVSPIFGGSTTLLRATNCDLGSPAFIVFTTLPPTQPYYFGPLGIMMDLGLPFHLLSTPLVAPNGVVSLEVFIPPGLPVGMFWLQTLQPGRSSNVVAVQTG